MPLYSMWPLHRVESRAGFFFLSPKKQVGPSLTESTGRFLGSGNRLVTSASLAPAQCGCPDPQGKVTQREAVGNPGTTSLPDDYLVQTVNQNKLCSAHRMICARQRIVTKPPWCIFFVLFSYPIQTVHDPSRSTKMQSITQY